MIKSLGIDILNNGAVTAPFHDPSFVSIVSIYFLSVVFNQMLQDNQLVNYILIAVKPVLSRLPTYLSSFIEKVKKILYLNNIFSLVDTDNILKNLC